MSWEMIQIFQIVSKFIQIVCEFCFEFKFYLNINKNLLFEVIVVFCYFFRFSHMHIVWWGLNPWKEGFTSVSLLPTKKLGRSSHDVTMTHYNVILILFLFRFAANAQALKWDNFFVLTINRRGVIRIYLLSAKMTPPPPPKAYTGLK